MKRRGFIATICGVLLGRFAPKPRSLHSTLNYGIVGTDTIAWAYKEMNRMFYGMDMHRSVIAWELA